MTCDFQQCGILTGADSGEPVQPHFKLKRLQMMFSQWPKSPRIFKRQAKALIRLHLLAGWSEPLLVPHTTLLEISQVLVALIHTIASVSHWHISSFIYNCIARNCANSFQLIKFF